MKQNHILRKALHNSLDVEFKQRVGKPRIEILPTCEDADIYLVLVSTIFYFHPDHPEGMMQFDEHIFQMGWFNHHLV